LGLSEFAPHKTIKPEGFDGFFYVQGIPDCSVWWDAYHHALKGCSLTTFADMNLDRRVLDALRRMDVMEPSPIQAAAIPFLIEGRDVVGQARTGSGKTLAFTLPMLYRLDPSRRVPQALVLVPTRELAGQVGQVVDKLAPASGLRAAQIYGGRNMDDQLMLLNSGPQIIIGTPGRLLDHLYRGSLSFEEVRYLVLDEADQMLDAGFGPDVDRILDCFTTRPQISLFSATVPGWVHDVIDERLDNPEMVKVDEEQRGPIDSVDHTIIEVPLQRKFDALRSLLDERGRGTVIIFARTKIGVERLGRQLLAAGYPAAALQGNLGQPQRERILRGFRRGNPPILVATNVAARGLDILSIEQVINYDLPESSELLTHRLGRTGRMGRTGSAVTLLIPAEARKWQAIEREIGGRVERRRWGEERIDPASTTAPAASTETVTAPPRSATRTQRAPRQRPRHDAVCADCGKATTVRFEPDPSRPVYCGTCYRQRRDSTAA
jgi:ATP-dependent RNA helicase DeaD